jgi:hypothetical protein
VSIVWKALVMDFPLIVNWLVWKVGNGAKEIPGQEAEMDLDYQGR